MVLIALSRGGGAQQRERPEQPSSVIMGRIVPEFTSIGVGLARYTYDADGELKLLTFKMARASREIGKFGEFRFENIESGDYYVYADPFGIATSQGEVLPFSFYPGVPDIGRASIIQVEAGADVRLNNLNLSPVPAPRLRLRLVDAIEDSTIDKHCASFSWKPGGLPGYDNLINTQIRCGPENVSLIPLPRLAPGTYDVYAGWSFNNPSGPVHGAAASKSVTSTSMSVVISFAKVAGTILLEQPDGSVKPAAGLNLELKPKRIGPTEWIETAADGSFRHDRVGQNDYTVQFTNLLPNAYAARLTDDGRDVLADGLTVRSVPIQLEGLISLAGGTLEGSIINGNKQPVPGAIVALIPMGRHAPGICIARRHATRMANFLSLPSLPVLINCSLGRPWTVPHTRMRNS